MSTPVYGRGADSALAIACLHHSPIQNVTSSLFPPAWILECGYWLKDWRKVQQQMGKGQGMLDRVHQDRATRAGEERLIYLVVSLHPFSMRGMLDPG